MESNGTYKMRIQLKADTEANWRAHPIVPLANEIIIYTADDTHSYARLKIGDGSTTAPNLPFVDAGTLNGQEVEIVKEAMREDFPAQGSSDKLYVDLSTNRLYHYTSANGYSQLSNFTYDVDKANIGYIVSWLPGITTTARIENNTLKITNGALPELLWLKTDVVTNITKGVQ